MNGTPQPEMAASAGIEPGSLDHESQPLTIGPFLQFSGKPLDQMVLVSGANIIHVSSPLMVSDSEAVIKLSQLMQTSVGS